MINDACEIKLHIPKENKPTDKPLVRNFILPTTKEHKSAMCKYN